MVEIIQVIEVYILIGILHALGFVMIQMFEGEEPSLAVFEKVMAVWLFWPIFIPLVPILAIRGLIKIIRSK